MHNIYILLLTNTINYHARNRRLWPEALLSFTFWPTCTFTLCRPVVKTNVLRSGDYIFAVKLTRSNTAGTMLIHNI
jgi:hypothetical protein